MSLIDKEKLEEFKRKQKEAFDLRTPIKQYLEKKYIPAEKIIPFIQSQGISGIQGFQGTIGVQGIKGEDGDGGPEGLSGNFDGGEPDTPIEDTLIFDFGEI